MGRLSESDGEDIKKHGGKDIKVRRGITVGKLQRRECFEG
jgi:hypothetical protein